jgi:hypothetical protein
MHLYACYDDAYGSNERDFRQFVLWGRQGNQNSLLPIQIRTNLEIPLDFGGGETRSAN